MRQKAKHYVRFGRPMSLRFIVGRASWFGAPAPPRLPRHLHIVATLLVVAVPKC